jgi:membrane associated rhomboid family serine protease
VVDPRDVIGSSPGGPAASGPPAPGPPVGRAPAVVDLVDDVVRVHLARPPFLEGPTRTAITLTLALTALVTLEAGVDALATDPGLWAWLGGALTLIVVLALVRLATRPRGDLVLELGPHGMHLPRRASSRATDFVRYEDVRDLELVGRAPVGALLIDTTGRLHLYPLARFREPRLAEALPRAIRERIARRPGGAEQLGRIEARRAAARVLASRRPRVLYVALGAIGLAYLIAQRAGAYDLETRLQFLRLGASVPVLVREHGEWWRLCTASLLHGNLPHLVVNAFALLSLGALLERWLGHARFAVILVLSCLGGAALSVFAARGLFSVGISTGLFGLLGALAVLHVRHRQVLPAGFRQSRTWWIVIAVINGGLSFLVPFIDGAGHLGGFLTGAVVTWAVDRMRNARAVRALAAAVVGAAAVGLGIGAAHASRDGALARDLARLAAALERGAGGTAARDPGMLNEVAWALATDRAAPAEAIPVARRLAERAVAAVPGGAPARADILDTLATLRYREGDADGAVRDELEVLVRTPVEPPDLPTDTAAVRALREAGRSRRALFVAQLARFLEARHAARGVIVEGAAAAPGAVERPRDAAPGGVESPRDAGAAAPAVTHAAAPAPTPMPEVSLDAEGPAARSADGGEALVLALLHVGARLEGLVEVCARPSPVAEPVHDDGAWARLRQRARATVVRVDARRDACAVGRVVGAPFAPLVDAVRDLP